MAGKEQNWNCLAFNQLYGKLKIAAPNTATNHIHGRWATYEALKGLNFPKKIVNLLKHLNYEQH